MASLIEAVAKSALKRLSPVAVLCLLRMASTIARFARVTPVGGGVPSTVYNNPRGNAGFIFNSMSDSIGVEFTLKRLGSAKSLVVACNLSYGSVFWENWYL